MRDGVAVAPRRAAARARRRVRGAHRRQHRRGGHRHCRGRRLFTAGDIVNVAARLEQAARAGDILARPRHVPRWSATRSTPSRSPAGGQGQGASRSRPSGCRRRADAPAEPAAPARTDGRSRRERGRLLGRFEQAVADRSCQLLTVLGAGRRRQVAARRRGRSTALRGAATVAAGRCLPYGDGLDVVAARSRRSASAACSSSVADRCRGPRSRGRGAAEPAGEPVAPRRGVLGGAEGARGARARTAARRSSSMTSTGPSRRSWTCSSTWPTGRATRRCCCW